MLRPPLDDCAPFFHGYVNRVPDGDVLAHLRAQGERTAAAFARLGEALAGHTYAAGKWSVRRVLQHVVDGERLFGYRALCIARGDTQSLPAFDEDAYAAHDGGEGRALAAVVAEYRAVREATLWLYQGFDAAAWARRGTVNGRVQGVQSLPWITAGHELHHLAVLRERYGLSV